ncbi:calcium/sodium antiporter [Marinicella sp. S1101]|uniref:calcium/sodium antiporter n=1 Tax=Marinicella marina TaxID=2996016 RepID=UPI0022609BC8|nr:calcium/sodium antiporter [Marinicella marina]MCX7554624.1 calcium/sodium antiporter [Marinicella marina]MDJ1140689.1 calcium/sodium antiporter [Marinicella marina]
MIESLSFLILGLVMLIYAADKFVLGAASTAKHMGVSTMLVGLIIVGFGTSAPEMVVSAIASFKGNSGLALGNAVGSNITNIALVLGVGLMIVPMSIKSQTIKREMPILLLVTLLVLFLLIDLKLTFVDGVILITGMFVVTGFLLYIGIKTDKDEFSDELEAEFDLDIDLKKAILFLIFGIIMLPVASQLMVKGATDIALIFGVSDMVIGLTIVALGTSLPELAATVASAMKKEHDLAIGNIVGSNMFNLLGVIGISGLIREYEFTAHFIKYDYFYMLMLTVFLFLASVYFVLKDRFISRIIGVILLVMYVSYMIWLYLSEGI